jgi:hypothetical protein
VLGTGRWIVGHTHLQSQPIRQPLQVFLEHSMIKLFVLDVLPS